MLFRYGTTENGTVGKKAHIYTQEEHGIDRTLVDADALWVVRRLRASGHRAYIVGGAVRDLLVGRRPNDFDVATDAHPQQIKRCFRSARVIGRRFRLVHVYCAREKYIEVSTFRSRSALGTVEHSDFPDMNNAFGTMEEDAERRDFTINALYYCPIDQQIIDYVGGMADVRHKRLRTLVKADASFAEDPVRMIRAVKYASLMGFSLPHPMAALIRRLGESLLSCSRERVTEEVYKILTSCAAGDILDLSIKLRMFDVIFPAIARTLRDSRLRLGESAFGKRLAELDERAKAGTLLDRNEMFYFLFRDLVLAQPDIMESEDPFLPVQQYIRTAAEPLFPSKKDLVIAAEILLKETRHHHRARTARESPSRLQQRDGTGEAVKTPGKRRRRHRGGKGRRRAPGAGPSPAAS